MEKMRGGRFATWRTRRVVSMYILVDGLYRTRARRRRREEIRRRHGSTLPGSDASLGSDLISGSTSASGSTPGSDVSLGSCLISGMTFVSGLSRKGRRITRADDARASRHSLQRYRRLPCSQMPEPPHSLHWLRCLPCSQKLEPPHSLQLCRTLPCSQIPFPGHSLQRYPPLPFPCGHNVPRGLLASPERDLLPRLFGMASCLGAERCDLRRSEQSDETRSVFSEA